MLPLWSSKPCGPSQKARRLWLLRKESSTEINVSNEESAIQYRALGDLKAEGHLVEVSVGGPSKVWKKLCLLV